MQLVLRVGTEKSSMFSDTKHQNFSAFFDNITLNLWWKIASNLQAEIENYESHVHLHLKSNESFWMHMHAQHMSKQQDHSMSTYKVDMA